MSDQREEGLSALLHEHTQLPPPEDLSTKAKHSPASMRGGADRLAFWANKPSASPGTRPGPTFSTGTHPSPSGFWAAS